MSKNATQLFLEEAVECLEKAHGNYTDAANSLGLARTTFRDRIATASRKNKKLAERIKLVTDKKNLATKVDDETEVDTGKRHAHLSALQHNKINRYVITGAQNATPVFPAFWKALLQYCEFNEAELIVIPYRYKNPTSVWTLENETQNWWAQETLPYLLNQRIELNKNLILLADIKTQPTAVRPLSGFDTITGGASAILAHPKLELITVPTPQHKLPKILTTTGACTQPNYTDTKTGKKGNFHHTFGACVVETSDDVFHIRQLNAVRNGSFMDLQYEYDADGVYNVDGIEALVMGDSHQEFIDPDVVHATFGKHGLINTLKPKYVVWHDVHDFYARNHHHKDKVFVNYAKHHAGTHNVELALDDTFRFVDEHAHDGINVFVPSNHPDALNKWVQATDPREDPENAVFWAKTFVACCEGARMTNTGVSTIDPFVYWAKQKMATADKAIFLRRDESFVVHGIELGYHGDMGPNGSRGSIGGFTKIGIKTIIGHSHSPGIRDGVYQVGLNSRYGLEYATGPSSWLQTDCIVYNNGKRTLINFINGQWRAK